MLLENGDFIGDVEYLLFVWPPVSHTESVIVLQMFTKTESCYIIRQTSFCDPYEDVGAYVTKKVLNC